MEAQATLAVRARAAVAAVEGVAAEIIHQAESAGPGQPYPAWLQRAGDRLTADPGHAELGGHAATIAAIRAGTDEAAAEYGDDREAAAAVAPWLAAMLSSRTRPEDTARLRAVLTELLPPYIKAARTTATTAAPGQ